MSSVRLIALDEWQVWRDLRLQALADSPDAFRATLDQERATPEAEWQDIVGSTSDHPRGNLWVADHEGRDVGMAFARIDEEFTTVYIGAMWVSPHARRLGVGDALLAGALDWGRASGTNRAELWVTEANAAAVGFYESHGFQPTDDTDVLRHGSDLVVRKLVQRLVP